MNKSLALINTRPLERAERLLPKTWGDEYVMPLLVLNPCPLDERLRQQLRQLSQAEMIIAVSPMAVEVAMRYLQDLKIDIQQYQHIQWLAVGQKTAQCLVKYKIKAQTPELETSEGIFQLPIFQQNIQRVAFLRGYGGREWLMQQCQQQGMAIDNILLYERSFPADSLQIWQDISIQLTQYRTVFVLISSGASWQNWLNLIEKYPVFPNIQFIYLVLGQRIFTQVATQYPAILLEHLHAEAILHAIGAFQ